RGKPTRVLVHRGGGVPALGERREEGLAGRIPEGARYAGVGVGRRWTRALMKAAAERSGGLFTQINPDEPVAWRAFELSATLETPRLLNARAEDSRSEEHTSELQSLTNLVCRLLLEKKKNTNTRRTT